MKLSIEEQIKRIKQISNRPEFESCLACHTKWIPFGKQYESKCPKCLTAIVDYDEFDDELEDQDAESILNRFKALLDVEKE